MLYESYAVAAFAASRHVSQRAASRSPSMSQTEGPSPLFIKTVSIIIFCMLILVLIVTGWSMSRISAQYTVIDKLRQEITVLQEGYETLLASGVEKNLERVKAELERDFRERMDRLEARARELEPNLDKTAAAVAEILRKTAPSTANLGASGEYGPYSFEIIHLTEMDEQNGQEVIYTKKSNLLQFFTPDKAINIVASHLFQVWQDNFLLLIYREKEKETEKEKVSSPPKAE